MDASLGRLKGIRGPTAASIGPSLSKNVPAQAVALTLTTSAGTPLDKLRADWAAEMIMAETWKAHRDHGEAPVSGAFLVTADSKSEWMGAPNADVAFTDGNGKPSLLTIDDQANYARQVQSAAGKASATVQSIVHPQSLGTAVQITCTVPDGRAFMARWGRTDAGLKVRDGDAEGIMVVVNDESGQLVKAMYWTAAAHAGGSIVNPKYDDLYRDDVLGTVRASQTSTTR